MSKVNVSLLRKAVEWAEAEAARGPDSQWDQRYWVTGSKSRAIERASREVDVQDDEGYAAWTLRMNELAVSCGTAYCIAGYVAQLVNPLLRDTDAVFDDDGSFFSSFLVAVDALGISIDQADQLFYANNTIEDIRRIAEEIAGEKL